MFLARREEKTRWPPLCFKPVGGEMSWERGLSLDVDEQMSAAGFRPPT